MILRAKKILREHMKRKKSHGKVMFVSMNVVNKNVLQPSNAREKHRKRPSARKKNWSH